MKRSLLFASASFAVIVSSSAMAQVAPPQSGVDAAPQDEAVSPAAANDQDIVVTGSRTIVDGSRAPTPVTVVSAQQLQAGAPGTVGEGLNQLPAFRGSTNAASGQTSSTSANSGSFINLRNLGAQRTLILLDGRRAPPSTVLGTVDTNILPQELIKRVDVVTGGASAAYGSDAVAGVVNFILDSRFEGVKGSVQAGTTTYGDNGTQKVTLTAGTSFAGGRGHIVASGSYYNADGVDSTFARAYGRAAKVVIRDPANPAQSIIVSNYHNTIFTPGGLIYGGAGLGLGVQQFGPGGTVLPFRPGTIANGVQTGGDGPLLDLTLMAKVRTKSAFTHVEFDVSDKFTLYAEGSYGHTRNQYRQVPDFFIPAFNAPTIITGNPYLPASIQKILTTTGQVGFQLGRYSFDTPPATATTTNETYNLVGGFRYKLPSNWQLEGYYSRSQNIQLTKVANDLIYSKFFAAVDAVRDPASGKIVCNVTLTNPGLYPGCVPINLFGNGSPSAEAINYIKGTAFFRAKVVQQVAELSVRGTLFDLPAGAVAVAVTGDYRKNSVVQIADPLSSTPVSATGLRAVPAHSLARAGSYQLGNVQPLNGAFDVKELAGEINVPILADTSAIGSLSFNGAVRYTDYSISGSVTTWKGGAVWRPVPAITLRGTVSRDIRAPNISELFGGSIQSQVAVNDTRNNVPANVIQSQVGSTNLAPEIAKTYTAGIVFSGIRGLTASVDYFNIDVKDVIASLTPQQTIDACTASATSSQCANLVYSNPAARTGLVRVFTPRQNLSKLKTSGIDFELNYATPLGGGALQVRGLMSYLLDYEIGIPGGATTDYTGVVGTSANPKVTALASVGYTTGPFTFYAQERLIGKGHFQASNEFYNPALADNSVRETWYTDITVKANVGTTRRLEIFGTVNNLFDRAPPDIPGGSFQLDYPTNASLYDVVGRTITAGVRFKL